MKKGSRLSAESTALDASTSSKLGLSDAWKLSFNLECPQNGQSEFGSYVLPVYRLLYKIITEQFIIKVLHKSVVWVNVQLKKDNP